MCKRAYKHVKAHMGTFYIVANNPRYVCIILGFRLRVKVHFYLI